MKNETKAQLIIGGTVVVGSLIYLGVTGIYENIKFKKYKENLDELREGTNKAVK